MGVLTNGNTKVYVETTLILKGIVILRLRVESQETDKKEEPQR